MNKLDIFKNRLQKVGIEIEMWSNIPWIYISKVNGNVVKERYYSEYGFTIAFAPIRPDRELEFTNIRQIFDILRKYR